MGELEAFYDTWLVRAGAAVIAGPSHYAGQWPDHAVMNMAPPARFACNRIAYRATILSDGRMTVCDQDFRGAHALGNVHERTIADLWSGAFMQDLRAAHASGVYDRFPLCPRCDEWHRP
jgi:hypothetical protein